MTSGSPLFAGQQSEEVPLGMLKTTSHPLHTVEANSSLHPDDSTVEGQSQESCLLQCQAMTCTGKAAQTHKKHTTGKKHPAPDDDAERPSKAARTEPMGQWPGAAVSTEHPHTMSIVPQQQQGPQQQGVLVPQMQQVVPVGFEPLMPQPDPQKTRNQQQQEAFGLPLPPLCAAALAHAGLANGPGLPQQAQNDHASVAQGRQQQALDYDDLTAAHGSTTATDGLTSVQLQPDTPVAGGEVMEVVQVPDKGLQLPGSTYATTQMGTSAADKAQTATPIVCPTNERIMQFLFGTIAPGDEVVITALADAGPEINLGRVSLRVEQFLGLGGNAAAYLATVRHLTGSCLATSLAPDSVVVFKFPAVLHVMLADNLKPGDPDNARKVATIVKGSTDLVKQDYSIARRCSRCPHTVHAYGVGMLQLVNHPTLAQLPAQLLEDCNLGSWGDLLYPGGLLDSSLIKTDAHTVRHIMQQVLEALVFMAKNGMMHRDIKPDNIMFQGLSLGCCAVGAPPASSYPTLQQAYPFVAKVGDFDSACHSLTGIDSGKNVGTLTFQAPELACSGNNHHTATVDVYSLAMCLLTVRTGTKSPFSCIGDSFYGLSYEDALQDARQRLEVLPDLCGQQLTEREMEFVIGGLQAEVELRWTPEEMLRSSYMALGPGEKDGQDNVQAPA